MNRDTKVMLVGGPTGFGTSIIERFNADSYSRKSGFNINSSDVRQDICETSLKYDCVILHSYTDQNSQFELLQSLAETWIQTNHDAHLIVTGSISSYFESYKPDIKSIRYSALKSGQDRMCKYLAKKCIDGKFKFKITVIKPGMLDTEKSRSKPHFTKGISSDVFCDTLEFIMSLPKDIQIPELVLETTYA